MKCWKLGLYFVRLNTLALLLLPKLSYVISVVRCAGLSYAQANWWLMHVLKDRFGHMQSHFPFSLTSSLPLSKSLDTCTAVRSCVCGTAHLCYFITLLLASFQIASDFALIARETKVQWGSLGGR